MKRSILVTGTERQIDAVKNYIEITGENTWDGPLEVNELSIDDKIARLRLHLIDLLDEQKRQSHK